MTVGLDPFFPLDGLTVSISAGATSANLKLISDDQISHWTGKRQVYVYNPSANKDVAIKFGANNTVTAVVPVTSTGATPTLGDIPIPAGSLQIITVDAANSQWVAAIAFSGSGNSIYFTPGQGI